MDNGYANGAGGPAPMPGGKQMSENGASGGQFSPFVEHLLTGLQQLPPTDMATLQRALDPEVIRVVGMLFGPEFSEALTMIDQARPAGPQPGMAPAPGGPMGQMPMAPGGGGPAGGAMPMPGGGAPAGGQMPPRRNPLMGLTA